MTPDTSVVATFKAPLYVAWELTHRCNARCLHCYSDSSPEARGDSDLSTEEAISVIDQLADAGLLVLAFSGGEPLLRRDWPDLVAHSVRRGLSTNIGSNGSNITEAVAARLEQLGLKSVTISLDSDKPEVHDHFRQSRRLHAQALNAIRRLVDHNLRVVVGFTPTRLNWTDGVAVAELACELGASAVNLSEYVPAGRGTRELALTPDELHSVLLQWIELRQRFQGQMEVMWHDCRVGLLVPSGEQQKYVGCGAGRLVARILPDGSVTPCVFLPTPIGHLRKESFQSMWRRSQLLRQFRERTGHISGICGSCEHLQTCGGCRAVAYAYSDGDPLAGDPHCWLKSGIASDVAPLACGESLPV